MDYLTWSGVSNHAADSTTVDVDDEAVPAGDHAIIDGYWCENQGTCRFPLDATGAEQDEPVWVLAAYEIVPGADDGGYSPLCDRATVR